VLDHDKNVILRGEWAGAFPPSPDYLHISPVISITPMLQAFPPFYQPGHIPKDAVVQLTLQRPVRIVRRDLEIDGIRLADYALR
jgi:hypothetical protein